MTRDQKIYIFHVYVKGHYSDDRLKEIFEINEDELQSIIKEFGATA